MKNRYNELNKHLQKQIDELINSMASHQVGVRETPDTHPSLTVGELKEILAKFEDHVQVAVDVSDILEMDCSTYGVNLKNFVVDEAEVSDCITLLPFHPYDVFPEELL